MNMELERRVKPKLNDGGNPNPNPDSRIQTSKKKLKNNVDDQPTSTHFPLSLWVEEIFPKLPVETLIRFKSVSKKWNSIISCPQFAQLHLSHSHSYAAARVRFLLIDLHGDLHIHNNGDGVRPLKAEVRNNFTARDVEFVGSCNGLVCSIHGSIGPGPSGCYFIWNPSTNESRRTCPLKNSPRKGIVFRGFGYASSIDDYKLVQATYIGVGFIDHPFDINVFSLRTGIWRKLELGEWSDLLVNAVTYGRVGFSIKPGSALVNETLHWVGFAVFEGVITKCQLFGFDLVKEEMIELEPPPSVISDHYEGDSFLSVAQDRLCLCNLYKISGSVEMWVFDQQGDRDRESWRKIFKADLEMKFMGSKIPKWNLFGGGLQNKIILRPYSGNSHLIVDFSRHRPKIISLPKELFLTFGISYVESLVSPFPSVGDAKFLY